MNPREVNPRSEPITYPRDVGSNAAAALSNEKERERRRSSFARLKAEAKQDPWAILEAEQQNGHVHEFPDAFLAPKCGCDRPLFDDGDCVHCGREAVAA